MTDTVRLQAGCAGPADMPVTPDEIAFLIATAARAPSVHNTQPWRFRVGGNVLEFHADPGRNLRQTDPDGREMLISCGAALYGLRLGLRKLGYLPVVELLPDPAQPTLIARIRPGGHAPITRHERDMLAAVPHRHTHRGPFAPVPVPARLLAGLGHDATAEDADLVLIDQPDQVRDLVGLAAAADRAQRASPKIRAELQRWTRSAGSPARDGIPAHAWAGPHSADVPAAPADVPATPAQERLPQRDFGLPGSLSRGGPPPSATAVLTTPGDGPADWLHAGQALQRMLLHAATRWVFASLQTQPLESPAARAELRTRLALDGMPQMLMQLGRANTAAATARRPTSEIIER
jgi:nitroreductase